MPIRGILDDGKKQATLELKDGSTLTLPWEGMSWARAFIRI